ncbi:hypothetical protein ON010_g14084 [Phytophthora cinnamomi]|nr:hypothetical protein ON010_g14084 [Phytophthora cinnamomi]
MDILLSAKAFVKTPPTAHFVQESHLKMAKLLLASALALVVYALQVVCAGPIAMELATPEVQRSLRADVDSSSSGIESEKRTCHFLGIPIGAVLPVKRASLASVATRRSSGFVITFSVSLERPNDISPFVLT